MADLATMKGQLTALQRARYTGARRVKFRSGESEREVEYRTDVELRQAISDLQAEINRLEGPAHPTTLVVRSSKGW